MYYHGSHFQLGPLGACHSLLSSPVTFTSLFECLCQVKGQKWKVAFVLLSLLSLNLVKRLDALSLSRTPSKRGFIVLILTFVSNCTYYSKKKKKKNSKCMSSLSGKCPSSIICCLRQFISYRWLTIFSNRTKNTAFLELISRAIALTKSI